MTRREHIVLLGCLTWGQLANAGPMEDYVQACEAPAHDGGWEASTVTCSAFLNRLSGLSNPAPEARLAMFKARAWLGHYSHSTEARCDEFRRVAEDLLNRSDVLYEFALCSYWPLPTGASERRQADEEFVSLLQGVLAIDPGHVDALGSLIETVRATGHEYGVDAPLLATYATTLYEITGEVGAARSVFEVSLEAGDVKKADAILERYAAT